MKNIAIVAALLLSACTSVAAKPLPSVTDLQLSIPTTVSSNSVTTPLVADNHRKMIVSVLCQKISNGLLSSDLREYARLAIAKNSSRDFSKSELRHAADELVSEARSRFTIVNKTPIRKN
jgi:hypothetical protein